MQLVSIMGLLLGPPELYLNPLPDLIPSLMKNPLQTLLPIVNKKSTPTFPSSGNFCLDFFFQILPDTPENRLIHHLELAWKQDPLTTLKLICNLRGVKGTGKADKEGFYIAALWLLKNHPKTLSLNINSFIEFGYLKDLSEILIRAPNNHAFHDQVSDLFVGLLVSDISSLNLGFTRKISLAAKWCPMKSDDSSRDLFESIAKRIFYDLDIEEACERLHNKVLLPLREALQMPEVYMTSKRWKELRYKRVASVAMNMYKKLFMEHDRAGFVEYLDNVKHGKARISAGSLQPHEILEAIDDDENENVRLVAELQWKRMIKDLSENGKMKDCLVICDVSESMEGTPLNVCIDLGLLMSDLSEDPWKGRIITFSEDPKIHNLKGKSLEMKKKTVMEEMKRAKKKDLQKVFDLILQVASKGKLTQKQMIKRVFVLSDMDFDQVFDIERKSDMDYKAIRRKFNENGYGWAIPEMVFWKVKNSEKIPVLKTQKGVALVSGFSKNLVKLFVNGGKIESPEAILKSAISGEEYQKLSVYD